MWEKNEDLNVFNQVHFKLCQHLVLFKATGIQVPNKIKPNVDE